MATFNNSGLKISRKIMTPGNFFLRQAIPSAHKFLISINYKHVQENIKKNYAYRSFFSLSCLGLKSYLFDISII